MNRIIALAGLLKFRLSAAVTFSAVTGFLLFSRQAGPQLFFTAAGVFLLACGAAAMNQFSERKFDVLMDRTMRRPIPSDQVSPGTALVFATFLLISGSIVLLRAGTTPMLLGVLTVFLYNVIYTSLKRVSWFAVIPGALVGAIPPVIGFTAAGGKSPDPVIVMFAVFMFLWQVPHFWLILIRYRNDYHKAGFKTLPDSMDDRTTSILVFIWVSITSVLLAIFSFSQIVFDNRISIILIPLNACFILLFWYVLFKPGTEKGARSAFILINAFSLAIMLLFIANAFIY